MTPKVSIVTPLHNKGAYVAETIESVLAQSMPDWEMIVVENYSTDEGPAIARGFAKKDARVRYVDAPPEVRGPGAARNLGLAEAMGEWVLFLDADDLLEPDHLSCLLAAASSNPMAPIVAGYWQEFTDGRRDRRSLKAPSCLGQEQACLQGACIAFAPWAVHAALVRRAVLKHDYEWPVELDRALGEDVHFWFRLVLDHPVSYATCRSALYRTHTTNRRNQLQSVEKWYAGLHAAVQCNCDHLQRRGLKPNAIQCESLVRLYSELSHQGNTEGRPHMAEEALAQARAWFRRRRSFAERLSATNRLRLILGLRIYNAISYGLLRKKR